VSSIQYTLKFVGLFVAVSVLLTSSQADESKNNHRSTKPAPLTTKNCDLTISSHIQALCEAYYSSDCQGTTTEAQDTTTEAQDTTTEAQDTTTEAQGTTTESPAQPLYDCKIPSKLVDPLFTSDTPTMAQTVMAVNFTNLNFYIVHLYYNCGKHFCFFLSCTPK